MEKVKYIASVRWRASDYLICFGGMLVEFGMCWLSNYPAASVVAVTCLAILMIHIYTVRTPMVFKYLHLFFSVVMLTFGCLSVEFEPQFLPELSRTSFFVGSIPLLVLCEHALLCTTLLFDAHWGVENQRYRNGAISLTNKSNNSNPLLFSLAVIAAVLAVILFLRVIANPSLLLHMDRFQYAANYLGGIWGRLSGAMSIFVVFSLMAIRGGKRLIGLLGLVPYMLFLVLSGEKFGGFFNIICAASLVFYDRILVLDPRKLRLLAVGSFAMAVPLVLIAALLNDLVFRIDVDSFIKGRLAQQGQLWWAQCASYDKAHPSAIEAELDAIADQKIAISENVGSTNGIYGVMYRTAPQQRVDKKLASGSRYTEAGYAAALYYFGPIGPIVFAVLMGLLAAFTRNVMITCVILDRPIDTALMQRIVALSNVAVSMFTFDRFFDISALVVYAFFVVAWLWRQRQHEPSDSDIRYLMPERTMVDIHL